MTRLQPIPEAQLRHVLGGADASTATTTSTSTLSNVLKTRHDTAKNTISNVR